VYFSHRNHIFVVQDYNLGITQLLNRKKEEKMNILCILRKQQTIDTIITKIPKTNFIFVKKKKENLSFA